MGERKGDVGEICCASRPELGHERTSTSGPPPPSATATATTLAERASSSRWSTGPAEAACQHAACCGWLLEASDHASQRPPALPASTSTLGSTRCAAAAAAAPGESRWRPTKQRGEGSPTTMRWRGAAAWRSHTRSAWSTEAETAMASWSGLGLG